MLSRRELLLGATALPVLGEKRAASERPNIVLLVAENVPAFVLGCYGNKEIRTPNLDRLAQTGARFSAHFAASSGTAANRASLYTGRTPMQHHVEEAAPASFSTEILLSDVLAGEGFTCGYFGVWGLGNDTQAQHHFTSWQTGAGSEVTASACQFIQQQAADKPFFLTAAFSHASEPPPRKYTDLYAQSKLDSMNYEPPAANAARNKEMFSGTLENLRRAAAAITAFDDQIPPVLEALRQRGVLDRTLVVFTSAGGALLGRHGLWGDGTASEPVNMYDETVALPMIWRWPERVPPASIRPELVSALDLVPSLCEVAGVAVPDRKLCGRSYLTLAMSKPLPKKQPWKTQVLANLKNTSMAREHRYKLIVRNHGEGPGELYDVAADPREKINQYGNPQFVSVRDRLAPVIAQWGQQYS